ncbi:MAG TPA: glutamine amidotransferase [Tepidisphaeraceae bacterium]|nr:glutamine amidotransferase [Tepidisphaeraceae bacterium]
MQSWSIDILRQGGWDLWTWICIAASLVLICYAIWGRLWTTLRGWFTLGLIAIGVGGTVIIVSLPPLHDARLGLLWTFVLMSILAATFYLQLLKPLGPRRMATLLTMRISALALLVPMLFEPVWQYLRQPTPTHTLAFLIDTSGSMSVPDIQNGPSRIQSVWQTLRPLLPQINQHFIPRFYTFDTDCRPLNSPDQLATLPADGKSTDIVGALGKVMNDLGSNPDADILLFSDGNDNVSPDVVDAVRASQRKIYTLTVGSPLAQPSDIVSLSVASVSAPDDVDVGRPTQIGATITSSALANRVVNINMSEVADDGKPAGPITTQRLVLEPVAGGQNIQLPFTAHAAGVRKLAIWIDPVPGERDLAGNRQDFQVLAIDPRIKVLYIEGSERPEYQAINRLLGHDANIEWATLLRLQQDRFTAAGTVDGQPFDSMPDTPAKWAQFDVIIVGDLDSSFLTPQEQSMIRQRVSEGGGFMMIGGEDNFGAGGYQGTPIEQILPVFVGGRSMPQEFSEFVPRLTAEGAAHPAMQGLSNWFGVDQKKPTGDLSPLRGNVVVAGAKAGAQVLLVHPDRPGPDGNPQIVLAVQQFGKGRTAAFTADTTNIWYRQFRARGQENVFNEFWEQLVRWLAGQDVRNRAKGPGIEALLNKTTYQFGESLKARAIVRDLHGDATNLAQVSAVISGGNLPKPIQIPLSAVDGRIGAYESIYPQSGSPGLKSASYSIAFTAAQDGKTLGTEQLKFTVIPPADEMLKIASNPALMQAIAQSTNAESRPLGEFPDLLQELIQTDPTTSQAVRRVIPLSNTIRTVLALAHIDDPWPPHYDLPTEGLLVLALLTAEWILRRKWQLP